MKVTTITRILDDHGIKYWFDNNRLMAVGAINADGSDELTDLTDFDGFRLYGWLEYDDYQNPYSKTPYEY